MMSAASIHNQKGVGTTRAPLTQLTVESALKSAVAQIHEAVKRGPHQSGVTDTERIMVSFATCDRQAWLPASTSTPSQLWQRLDDRQRAAVATFLGSEGGGSWVSCPLADVGTAVPALASAGGAPR